MSKKVKAEVKSTPPKNTASQAPAAGAQVVVPDGSSIATKIQGKEMYLFLGALFLTCIFVFRDFLTFEKVYLFKDIGSDSLNIYLPWLTQLSDAMKDGVPTWSFSQGLGQNVFPLWLGDFFADFIMLFGKERIPYLLAYAEVAKVILCGVVFYKYLTELKLNKLTVGIVAYLFAFSGFVIMGSSWFIYTDEALYVAVILFGFERWLNHGKIFWFVFGVTILSFLQPFLLFPHAIFLSLYIPVRYNDVRPGSWSKFPVFILKTVGIGAVGVAISAYQLLPDLLQYIESPRVGGEARLIEKLKAQPIFGVADEFLRFTTTFRAFGSDMLGTGTAFQGWQNYLEAPLFYCGILCLVVLPQMFAGLNKQQRIAYGIFGGVFLLPVFFPFFRYSFWAYTGDYFRTFSLVFTLLLLIFTAKALDHVITSGKVNKIVLGVTAAFLMMLLFTPNDQFAPAINVGLRSFAALLILVYGGLLIGLTTQGSSRRYSIIALCCVVFFEMFYFSSQTVNERDAMTGAELKDKVGFNDYTVEAVKYLKEKDKSFYRLNKDYSSGLAIHQSINDAKVQGYYGSASYHSFNQKNYIKFLGAVNVLDPKDENATRWAMGVNTRPLLFSLMGGKYWLIRRHETQPGNFGYDSVAKFGNVAVYQNRYAYPFGFAYDTVLDEQSFSKLSIFRKDLYLLRGCVVANDDADMMSAGKQFNLADTATGFSMEEYGKYADLARKKSFTMTQFKESDIAGTITLDNPGVLFFSIPYDEGWKAYVNGKEAKISKVNFGFIGLKMGAGKSEVKLQFEPRLMKKGAMISLVGLAIFGVLIFLNLKKKSVDAEVA